MAKDPEQRYQTGAEFAADVLELQQLFDASSTTSSLRTVAAAGAGSSGNTSTGTRSTGIRTTGIRTTGIRAVETRAAEIRSTGARTRQTGQRISDAIMSREMERAETIVRDAFQKAPLRNLGLAAAAFVVILISAVQSKVLVISPRLGGTVLSPASSTTPAAPKVESLVSGSAPGSNTPTAETATANSRSLRASSRSKPRRTPMRLSPQTISASVPEIVMPPTNLDLAVEHQFKDATLFVWVDDQLLLTRPLHGGIQKRMVVFNGIRGAESETLKIPAGRHALRVRALSSDETIDLSKTILAEFIGGGERTLRVTFEKHNTIMHLMWQ
jgi:hypothetical protein